MPRGERIDGVDLKKNVKTDINVEQFLGFHPKQHGSGELIGLGLEGGDKNNVEMTEIGVKSFVFQVTEFKTDMHLVRFKLKLNPLDQFGAWGE